jgi:hypothetical protein
MGETAIVCFKLKHYSDPAAGKIGGIKLEAQRAFEVKFIGTKCFRYQLG